MMRRVLPAHHDRRPYGEMPLPPPADHRSRPAPCAPPVRPGSPHLRGQHTLPGHRGQPTGTAPALASSAPNPYATPQPTRCNVPANDHPISARTLATVSSAGFEEPIKPRLRGWSHAAAALGAIGVTAGMLVATAHDRLRFFSILIFG